MLNRQLAACPRSYYLRDALSLRLQAMSAAPSRGTCTCSREAVWQLAAAGKTTHVVGAGTGRKGKRGGEGGSWRKWNQGLSTEAGEAEKGRRGGRVGVWGESEGKEASGQEVL